MRQKKKSNPHLDDRKIILGIETSCDDTSLCLLEVKNKSLSSSLEVERNILSLNSYNQDFLLKKWGGVVPELAARSHVKAIPPLLDICLKEASIDLQDISELAVTTHPGLIGPLLTGINLAKTFSLIQKLPITPVNHLYAHLEAIHLTQEVTYPYLGLLVSGGHSAFWLVEGANQMNILGTTLDDAAGEAFDKGGKLLGVGYPAGRIIDELSQDGDKNYTKFPISYLRDRPGKMSFSGLKTALRVMIQRLPDDHIQQNMPHLCASYQEAIVQTLKIKTVEVIEKILGEDLESFSLPIVIGGGVASNSRLREVFQEHFSQVHFVSPIYCTDNAAMIANWASRVENMKVTFPDCLELDPRSRFIEKK